MTTTVTFDQGKTLVNASLIRMHDIIENLQGEVPALLFEMQKVVGNWKFKESVLGKLVPEFQARVDERLKAFQDARDAYFAETSVEMRDPEAWYPTWDAEFKKRFQLVKFIANWFRREVVPQPGDIRYSRGDGIHDKHSHLSFAKLLRRMDRRMSNALDYLDEFIREHVRTRAARHIVNVLGQWLQINEPAFFGMKAMVNYFSGIDLPEELLGICCDILRNSGGIKAHVGQVQSCREIEIASRVDIRYFGDPLSNGETDWRVLVWPSREREQPYSMANGNDGLDLGKIIEQTRSDTLDSLDWYAAWLSRNNVAGWLAWQMLDPLQNIQVTAENVASLREAIEKCRAGTLVKQYGACTLSTRDFMKGFLAAYSVFSSPYLDGFRSKIFILYPDLALAPVPANIAQPITDPVKP